MDENMNYTEQNAAQQPEQQPFEQQPQENGFTMYDQQQYYQQQPMNAANTWVCQNCGRQNDGQFCQGCGKPKQ